MNFYKLQLFHRLRKWKLETTLIITTTFQSFDVCVERDSIISLQPERVC